MTKFLWNIKASHLQIMLDLLIIKEQYRLLKDEERKRRLK